MAALLTLACGSGETRGATKVPQGIDTVPTPELITVPPVARRAAPPLEEATPPAAVILPPEITAEVEPGRRRLRPEPVREGANAKGERVRQGGEVTP